MSKLECDYLGCGETNTLIIAHNIAGREWGLCGLHDNLISQKGATIVRFKGINYVTTPEEDDESE